MEMCRAAEDCRQLVCDKLLHIFLKELYSTEEHQIPKRIVLSGSGEYAIWCKPAVLVSEMRREWISETWAEKDVRRFTK